MSGGGSGDRAGPRGVLGFGGREDGFGLHLKSSKAPWEGDKV